MVPIANSPSPRHPLGDNKIVGGGISGEMAQTLSVKIGAGVEENVTVRMPTFSLEVITLPVSDVERALRFYVVERPGRDRGGYVCTQELAIAETPKEDR
jgi:hypothetical protein